MQAVPALTKPRSGDRSFHANVCFYLYRLYLREVPKTTTSNVGDDATETLF